MKKIMIMVVSIVLGIALNGCTSTSYPVTDMKIKKDISDYLVQVPHFSEVVSVELGTKKLEGDQFTVNATVEVKNKVAKVSGDIVVVYTKIESAWVRNMPKLTVNSAIAYADPTDIDVLNPALGLNRSGIENRFDFNYYLEDFEITDKTVTLNENKALYEVTSEKTWWNSTATLTLGVDVRYTYEEGWKPIAIPYEHFTETSIWDGQYQIQLDEAVSGSKSFPIILNGTIEIAAKSDGSIEQDGSVHAIFTLDGFEHDLEGSAWVMDNDLPTSRYLMFYFNQTSGNYLRIGLIWAGHETDPYLVYTVSLNGVSGTMTPIN